MPPDGTKNESISLPASCLSEMMMRRRHFYVMEWMFCELEIYSSPLNSSLQQTCINDLVLLSLMDKKARDSLLHPSVSQFMDSQRGSQSQLNCTLIEKNVTERVNEHTLGSKVALQQRNLSSIQHISQSFTPLPNNYPAQTQMHCSAFSQKMKVALFSKKNPKKNN